MFLTILTVWGCTFDSKAVGFDTSDTGTQGTTSAKSGCSALFDTAGGALDTDVIQCIESTFEENGYPFDAQPCNDLEGAWYLGSGTASLWSSCQKDEGFGDSDCDQVLQGCF
jgi:hypothetical protein